MALNKTTLKQIFNTALNTHTKQLMESTSRNYYETVNAELAKTLTDAIDVYIKGGVVNTAVSTTVSVTTAGSAAAQSGGGTGTGTGVGNIT